MPLSEGRYTSIIMRLVTLLAFTLFYIFSGLVVIENRQLHKLLSPTFARSMMILVGYCLAVISVNYALALRAKNFTNWRTELTFVAFFVVLVAGGLAGHLFPLVEGVPDPPKWKFWADGVQLQPDHRFKLIWFLLIPLGFWSMVSLTKIYPATNQKPIGETEDAGSEQKMIGSNDRQTSNPKLLSN